MTTSNEWRAPPIPDNSEMVFDEPGRVFPKGTISEHYGLDCASHHFRVSREHGAYTLHVRHGGGDESWPMKGADKLIIEGLRAMTSDQRFRLLWCIMDANKDSRRTGACDTANRYAKAFVDGKLKKRKVRNTNEYKVWIED